MSKDCNILTHIPTRKNLLKRQGRCFICLRKNHLARNCEPQSKCFKCNKRHDVSIREQNSTPTAEQPTIQVSDNTGATTTTTAYLASSNSVLLQTARANLKSTSNNEAFSVRLLFDSRSQKSYITEKTRTALRLSTIRKQTMMINAFGNTSQELRKKWLEVKKSIDTVLVTA